MRAPAARRARGPASPRTGGPKAQPLMCYRRRRPTTSAGGGLPSPRERGGSGVSDRWRERNTRRRPTSFGQEHFSHVRPERAGQPTWAVRTFSPVLPRTPVRPPTTPSACYWHRRPSGRRRRSRHGFDGAWPVRPPGWSTSRHRSRSWPGSDRDRDSRLRTAVG
jgi:hypothetical protein